MSKHLILPDAQLKGSLMGYEHKTYALHRIMLPGGWYTVEELEGFAKLARQHREHTNKLLEESLEQTPTDT